MLWTWIDWWSSGTTVQTPFEWKRKRRRPSPWSLPVTVLLLAIFAFEIARSDTEEESNIADLVANVSHLLDTLLAEENYDRQIRPGFGGEPTIVYTDLEIRSFGPVTENEKMYSMDCYFRQTWFDKRLKFSRGSMEVLSMDWKFLQKVWTPDTYFLNGKSSHIHKVTVPNKFIRLRQDGQLKYSMRVTIKANCPMHLRKYPMDTQACPLEIGSYGYQARDVIYRWKSASPVIISPDVTLSQYAFLNITTANNTEVAGEKSSVKACFILQRRRGYFILQFYAPCAMIVGASWVAFWINRNDPAGRVTVGATTVLTLVTMGFTGRANLPRANYPTALDWFVIMCFTFVFAALVEYACVNFIDRYEKQVKLKDKERIRNEIALRQHEAESRRQEELRQLVNGAEEEETEVEEIEEERHLRESSANHSLRQSVREEVITLNVDVDEHGFGALNRLRGRLRRRKRRKSRAYRDLPLSQLEERLEEQDDDPLAYYATAAKLDRAARIVFPCTFGVLNILYWTMYLYVIDDEVPGFDGNSEVN